MVSGTTGFDYATKTIDTGIEGQTEQYWRNINAAPKQPAASMLEIGKCTTS